MEHFCGIDFGTSNSVISIISPHDGKLSTTSLMEPSVMFFPARDQTSAERYMGNQAIERYLASGMNGRFFQSVKTLLPDPDFLFTRINGKPFKVEDLVAAVLRHLRIEMEKKIQAPLESLVLGRPARFSIIPERDQLAQDRLERAARQAGFRHIQFELEPIAAAYSYEREISQAQLVLVGDFGGGTSDFTIMRLDPARRNRSGRQDDILATGGVYVGGDAFDADIMRQKVIRNFGSEATYESYGQHLPVPCHIFNTICQWDRIHFLKSVKSREEIRSMMSGSSDRAGIERLLQLIEQDLSWGLTKSVQSAKHELSSLDDSRLHYEVPAFTISENLSLAEFNQAISRNVSAIQRCTEEVLRDSGVAHRDISAVFLTGGSSRVRQIKHFFHELFGEAKVHIDTNQFVSIAQGLSLKALELGA